MARTVKMTFTLDEGTARRIDRTAERLGIPKSGVAPTRTQSPTAPSTPISVASSPREVSQSGQKAISTLMVAALAEANSANRTVGEASMSDSRERLAVCGFSRARVATVARSPPSRSG